MQEVAFYMCGGEHDRVLSEIPIGIGYMLTNALDGKLSYVKYWKKLQGCALHKGEDPLKFDMRVR